MESERTLLSLLERLNTGFGEEPVGSQRFAAGATPPGEAVDGADGPRPAGAGDPGRR
jgi:hypothetical protein